MSEGENRETHNVETVLQMGTHVVDEKGIRPRHGGSAPGRLVPAMTGPEQHADTVERLAQALHEAYERLAPQFGYTTRRVSAVPWEDVPAENRSLMIAVVGEVVAPALLALADRADTLERERDKWREEELDFKAAEAALIADRDRLERERDELVDNLRLSRDAHWTTAAEKNEARAEAERLREALRVIEKSVPDRSPIDPLAGGLCAVMLLTWPPLLFPAALVVSVVAIRQTRRTLRVQAGAKAPVNLTNGESS